MARLVRGRQHYYEENWATKKTILRAIVLDEKSLALIGNASGRTGGEGGRLDPRRFR